MQTIHRFVAQWRERDPPKVEAAGSIPAGASNIERYPAMSAISRRSLLLGALAAPIAAPAVAKAVTEGPAFVTGEIHEFYGGYLVPSRNLSVVGKAGYETIMPIGTFNSKVGNIALHGFGKRDGEYLITSVVSSCHENDRPSAEDA